MSPQDSRCRSGGGVEQVLMWSGIAPASTWATANATHANAYERSRTPRARWRRLLGAAGCPGGVLL